MKRFLIALAFCAALTCSAFAQGGMGPGPGTVHSTGGGGFTGPGDIITFKEIFSSQCYTNAYTGDVADIWDTATGSTTETKLTCSAGGTVNETINPLTTTCAVSCSALTIYSQTGSGNVLGNVPVATAPLYIRNCTNSKGCFRYNTSISQTTNAITQGAPATVVSVASRTGGGGSYANIGNATDGCTFQIGYNPTANTIFMYDCTTEIDATGADNTFNFIMAVYLGTASSSLTINNGTPVTGNVGTSTMTAALYGTGATNGSPLVGDIAMIGIINANASSSGSTLCHNQRLYFGTAGSC